MEHFEECMGCIEIQGKSGHIERVYFEVKQSRLIQWNETQIQVYTVNEWITVLWCIYVYLRLEPHEYKPNEASIKPASCM